MVGHECSRSSQTTFERAGWRAHLLCEAAEANAVMHLWGNRTSIPVLDALRNTSVEV